MTQASGEKVNAEVAAAHYAGALSPATNHSSSGGGSHSLSPPLSWGILGDPVMLSIVSGRLGVFCSQHVYGKLRSSTTAILKGVVSPATSL